MLRIATVYRTGTAEGLRAEAAKLSMPVEVLARNVRAFQHIEEKLRAKYMRTRATKFPKWINGFLMVKNGYFYPLSMKGTDWNEFLGAELAPVLRTEADYAEAAR